jgi:hypothetical protein
MRVPSMSKLTTRIGMGVSGVFHTEKGGGALVIVKIG